jgi:hypothetical protein
MFSAYLILLKLTLPSFQWNGSAKSLNSWYFVLNKGIVNYKAFTNLNIIKQPTFPGFL